jgi:hypothetical protein
MGLETVKSNIVTSSGEVSEPEESEDDGDDLPF